MPDEREPVATVPTRSSPAKGAGAGAGAAGLAGCEGARTGCALRARAGRGAGFFFATFFLTGGVFLRVIGFLAGVFRRLDLAFFLVAICVPRSDLSTEAAPNELQAFRSVIRMIATTFPSLNAFSFVPLLQVQT